MTKDIPKALTENALKKRYKSPTRAEKMCSQIEHAVSDAKKYSNMKERELVLALGMSEATFWRRLRNPDSFTLGELRIIALLSGRDFSTFLSEIVK